MSNSLQHYGLWPTRLLCPWGLSRQESGVGCHALLQGIFLPRDQTQVSCVSCIAGGFFTTSATWEAHNFLKNDLLYTSNWVTKWCFNFVAFYSFKCHMLVWTISSIYLNFYFKIIHLSELDLLLENSSLCTLVSSAIKKVYYLVLLGMFHDKQFSVLFYYESLNIFRHCLENAFGLSINKYWSITYFSQVLCKYNKEYKQSINYVSCTTVTYNLKWPHINSTNYNKRQNVHC